MHSFKKRIKTALSERLGSHLHDPKHSELQCAVEKCTTLYGFGLGVSDWHYLASTMREYLAEPRLPLEKTQLWSYFQKFQPANMHEALFGGGSDDESGASILSSYRDPERGPMPWTSEKDIRAKAHTAAFKGDYGPWPHEAIAGRFVRIKEVCDAINKQGYDPARAMHEEDTIRGVMLMRGDDWRMVILGGNHRSCALAALGYSHIPVRPDRTLPAVIDIDNASQWPCVREGAMPESLAVKIATSYFESSGNKKAAAWGIISPTRYNT